MSEAERFSFDAGRYTANVAVDGSDIVWALEENGSLEEIQSTLKTYRATLDKCAVTIEQGAISVAAEVNVLGFIKAPLKAVGVVELNEDEIALRFSEAWLGRLLPVPAEKLCALLDITPEELGFSIDREEHPWLETASAARLEQGELILECDMGKVLFEQALKDYDYRRKLTYFADDNTVLKLAMPSYYTEEDYVPEGFEALLTSMQQAYSSGGLTQTRNAFLDNRSGEALDVKDFVSDWSLYEGWFKADTVRWVFMSKRTARLKLEGVPQLGDVPAKGAFRYDWDTGERLEASAQLPLGMALELTGGGHATAYTRVDDSMVLVEMEYNDERGLDEYEILQQDCDYIPTVLGRLK